MRASTLATLELVSTVPETTSPGCATGVLIDIAKIRGGAFAGSIIGSTCATCGATVAATIGSTPTVSDPSFGTNGVVDGPDVGAGTLCGTYTTGPVVGTGGGVGGLTPDGTAVGTSGRSDAG